MIGGHFLYNLWFGNNLLFKYLFFFTGGLHYILVFIILRHIWTDNSTEKKKKTDNTYMVLFLGIIGMWLWLPKMKKYDIDFSDENIAKLNSSIESISEFLDKNGMWDFIKDFKTINESALDYDFNKFRESTINPALVGTINSINDGIFSDSKIENEFKVKFKNLLEVIINMGHNHPDIIRTYKSL